MTRLAAVAAAVVALLACCGGVGAASEPALSVVAQAPAGGRARLIADPGDAVADPTFSVTVDGAPQPLSAGPLLSDRLAMTLVVDASAGSAPVLPAGLSGIADFALGVPPAARAALVTDTAPPVVVLPPSAGPAALLAGLDAVTSGGDRSTAQALDVGAAQLPADADGPRLVVLWTTAPDAAGPSAADLAARLRAAGVVLAVVTTGGPASTYWPAAAAGTGGVAVATAPDGVAGGFTTLAAALRHRYLLTFPAPARLPAPAVVRAVAPGRVLVAQAPLPSPVEPPPPPAAPGAPIVVGAAAASAVTLLLVLAASLRRRPRPPARAWNVPARAEPALTRDLLLEAVAGALEAGRPVVVTPEARREGAGVTTVMVEHAHRHADEYDVAWWVSARDPQLIPDQLAQLAVALGAARPADPAYQAMGAALGALHARGRWLVVFDDAESTADLAGFLPTGPGHVLVGTTRPGPARSTRRVTVPVFTRAESVRLLRERQPGLTADVADAVAARLEDLPVAVDVAGAAPDAAAAAERGVWSDAADRLAADDPAALALLTLLAWLGPEPVPLSVITGALPGALAGPGVTAAVDVLARRALVRAAGETVRLHPVPAAHLVERSADERPDGVAWAVWAVRLLRAAVPSDPADPAGWPAWRQLMPHVLAATDPGRLLDDVKAEVGWLLHHAAGFLQARGAAGSARALFEDARELGHEA